jgi:hypothetical protein
MDRKQTPKMTGQQPGCFARRLQHNPFLIALLPGNFWLPEIRKYNFKIRILKILKKMKSKKLTLTMSFMLFSFFFMATSCGEPDTSENLQKFALQGTTWKLEGYINTKTGSMIEAEPKGGGYYTFTFDTDTTARGHSISNKIQVLLKPTWSNQPIIAPTTYIDDSMNGNAKLFYDAIRLIESYAVENNELKFFYDSKQQYLLFKPVEP